MSAEVKLRPENLHTADSRNHIRKGILECDFPGNFNSLQGMLQGSQCNFSLNEVEDMS